MCRLICSARVQWPSHTNIKSQNLEIGSKRSFRSSCLMYSYMAYARGNWSSSSAEANVASWPRRSRGSLRPTRSAHRCTLQFLIVYIRDEEGEGCTIARLPHDTSLTYFNVRVFACACFMIYIYFFRFLHVLLCLVSLISLNAGGGWFRIQLFRNSVTKRLLFKWILNNRLATELKCERQFKNK